LLATAKDLTAQRRKTLWIIVMAMLVCVALNHFGLRPVMAAMKEAGQMSRFGMLHGISMVIYLATSLLAGLLVIKNP
ncbi:MAG: DUF4149 domain-containing protein, partial [Pseudomonadota bacterium]